MSSFIEVKDLVHKFSFGEEEFLALDKVSLEVQKGEFIALLGHNGSGKSTLAKHLNAILEPDSGYVKVEGIDTRDYERLFDIRQKLGLVFQNPDNQIIATIVEDDVAFGPENLGAEPKEIRKRVDQALEAVGMTKMSGKAPHNLSGGQKQRVAIAGVLAMQPDGMVLDESTAMLDPGGRKEVLETVQKLNRENNITVVLITHYMEEAVLADKIYVMESGRIVMSGTPKEIFSQKETLESYGLDVPPMTKLAYKLKENGIDISCDILTVEEMLDYLCQLKSKI